MFKLMFMEAWSSLMANRTRSFLTMLGMIIGVGAVILMMSFGQGVKSTVEESIQSMGSNLFIILSGSSNMGGVRTGGGGVNSLTTADAQAIQELSDVASAAPVDARSAQVVQGARNWNTSILGSTPALASIRAWNMKAGMMFTDGDVRAASKVVVLGKTVVKNLFDEEEDPVGKMVRINSTPFLVIGVLAEKGQSLDGRDQDDTILTPLTTAQKYIFGSNFPGTVRLLLVQIKSAEQMTNGEKNIAELLRQRHRIRQAMDDDFSIRNLTALAETAASSATILSYFLGAIASISLLVGGIGIMNIMLVSVTERTREIGIRLAIGAQKWHVLFQFILEATLLSILGCFLGVILGVGGAFLLSALTNFKVVVQGSALSLSFLVSFILGLFFGIYPAKKASNLNPIEALRFQ